MLDLEIYVYRGNGDQAQGELVGTAPLSPGSWFQTSGERLTVDPRLNPHMLDFRVGLGGKQLAGLLRPEDLREGEDLLEVELDPLSGVGRKPLSSENGEEVFLEARTSQPLARPVRDQDGRIVVVPVPQTLPGV